MKVRNWDYAFTNLDCFRLPIRYPLLRNVICGALQNRDCMASPKTVLGLLD